MIRSSFIDALSMSICLFSHQYTPYFNYPHHRLSPSSLTASLRDFQWVEDISYQSHHLDPQSNSRMPWYDNHITKYFFTICSRNRWFTTYSISGKRDTVPAHAAKSTICQFSLGSQIMLFHTSFYEKENDGSWIIDVIDRFDRLIDIQIVVRQAKSRRL